mmetsp:Transcript_33814/g.70286  ORF Transcript_33814/g.70286 Transcript_33814/m.70286 type:complete len:219 (+) Transcript_33814:379-1035(+)
MTGSDNHVLLGINGAVGNLFRGRVAPQKKDQAAILGIICIAMQRQQGFNYGIGKFFPSLFGMTMGLSLPYGQDRVEQQDALFGPMFQITVLTTGRVLQKDQSFILQFLQYIAQGGRYPDSTTHRKGQSVRLPRAVVRVLPQNDHSDLIHGTCIECRKDFLSLGWENHLTGLFFLFEKQGEFAKDVVVIIIIIAINIYVNMRRCSTFGCFPRVWKHELV